MNRTAPTPNGRTWIGRTLIGRAWIGVIACALLALLPAGASHAQRIGRLFSNPEQRVELDALRNDPGAAKEPTPVAAAVTSKPEPEREPSVSAVTINGVVFRGGVRRVSWINAVAVGAGAAAAGGIRIDTENASGGQIRIQLPDGRSDVDLKPGQTIDIARGRVLEGYEHRPPKDAAPAPRPDRGPRPDQDE